MIPSAPSASQTFAMSAMRVTLGDSLTSSGRAVARRTIPATALYAIGGVGPNTLHNVDLADLGIQAELFFYVLATPASVGAPVNMTVLRASQGAEMTLAMKRARIIPTTVVYERRGDVALIRYLVSKGADVTAVARTGQTTVDMANGPVQRVQPYPDAIELLESLGAKNNHKCVSC